MSSMTIGFVGAGKMGGGIARNLAAHGHKVHVFDLDPAAVAACVDAGALAAQDAVAAAREAEVVFTSLPLPEHVLTTWAQIRPHLRGDAVAVDVSTIDPTTAGLLGDQLGEHGIPFVTCALGKTPAAAEAGQCPLFVGGPAETVEALRPLLDTVGRPLYDFGSAPAAATFKLISNLIGMTNLAVLAEGYLLARRAGIDPEQFRRALEDTGARSFQSDVRLPWLCAGDFAPRFATALAAKDVRLAVDAAARWSLPAPVAAAALQQLVAASAHGHSGEDAIAVAKAIDPRGQLLVASHDEVSE